jgi:Leucine-rich repeat (LRR) protein
LWSWWWFSPLLHLSVANTGLHNGTLRLGSLPSLLTIDLRGNAVSCAGALVEALVDAGCASTLRRLVAGHNHIARLAPLQRLCSLQDLNLSHNELAGVVSLPPLPALRTLVLAHNCISGLVGVQACPRLDSIDLSHNELRDVDSVVRLRDCVDVGKLTMRDNPAALCPRYRLAMYVAPVIFECAGALRCDCSRCPVVSADWKRCRI